MWELLSYVLPYLLQEMIQHRDARSNDYSVWMAA